MLEVDVNVRPCLIDKFFVPKEAAEEFLNRMNYNRDFIRKLPGFIGDKAYHNVDDVGNLHIITIAEWESPKYFADARNAVQSEYKRIGFDIATFASRLGITMERALYNVMDI
jgi:heme-degrading monooxygenase HmoA